MSTPASPALTSPACVQCGNPYFPASRETGRPIIFNCGHTICENCAGAQAVHLVDPAPGKKSCCSLCRADINDRGVENVALAEFALAVSRRLNPTTSTFECAYCRGIDDEHTVATFVCVGCKGKNIFCCDSHKAPHAGAGHAGLIPVKDYQSAEGGASPSKPPPLEMCKTHEKYPLDHYCFTDSSLECLKCCTEAHSSHEYVPLDDAAPKLRAVIGGLNEKANKAAEEAREQAQALEQEKQKLKDSYEASDATCIAMFAELHAALDQAQKEVLRVAKARWDKRAKEMQASIEDRQRTATLLQQVLDMCNSPVSSVATLPAPSLPDLLTSASKTVQGLTRAPPTAPVPTTIEIKTNKDAILRMIPLVAWASDDVIPPRDSDLARDCAQLSTSIGLCVERARAAEADLERVTAALTAAAPTVDDAIMSMHSRIAQLKQNLDASAAEVERRARSLGETRSVQLAMLKSRLGSSARELQSEAAFATAALCRGTLGAVRAALDGTAKALTDIAEPLEDSIDVPNAAGLLEPLFLRVVFDEKAALLAAPVRLKVCDVSGRACEVKGPGLLSFYHGGRDSLLVDTQNRVTLHCVGEGGNIAAAVQAEDVEIQVYPVGGSIGSGVPVIPGVASPGPRSPAGLGIAVSAAGSPGKMGLGPAMLAAGAPSQEMRTDIGSLKLSCDQPGVFGISYTVEAEDVDAVDLHIRVYGEAVGRSPYRIPASITLRGSTVLNELEASLLNRFLVSLREWLPFASRPRLLFRMSRDGSSTSNFHSKCDNYASTLILVKSSNKFVFGGYAGAAWPAGHNGAWIHCHKSFIFTVKNPEDWLPPTRFVLKNPAAALCTAPAHGPLFGSDLRLGPGDNNLASPSSFTDFPHSYADVSGGRGPLTFTNAKTFTAAEVEVWHIPMLIQ